MLETPAAEDTPLTRSPMRISPVPSSEWVSTALRRKHWKEMLPGTKMGTFCDLKLIPFDTKIPRSFRYQTKITGFFCLRL